MKKKSGVKLAKSEAKKIVKAVKAVEKKEGGHKSGSKKPKSSKPVASSSMKGQKKFNAPVSVGMSTRSYFQVRNLTSGKYKGGVRITGRDYFQTAYWNTSAAAGTALVNVPVNPSALDGTRLAQFTELYEKYRFNRFKIYACPTSSTSTSGAYGMSYDRDPSDATPAVGDPGIREYMSFEGSTTASAWLASELDAPLMEPVTDFFVNAVSGGDERLVDQGQFYLWVYTPTSANTQIALEIEYDLTLYVPQTNGSVGAIDSYVIAPAGTKRAPQVGSAGWNPLNNLKTGNTGSWSTRTTLGDVAKIVGIDSATADFAIQLAGGLYTIIQSFSGVTTTAPAAGVFVYNLPTFTANKAEEQSLYAAERLSVSGGNMDGVSTLVSFASSDNLYIPPSGGVITADFFCPGDLPTKFMASGGILELVIGPGFYAASPTNIFSPLLGKPGKFGDKVRAEYKARKEKLVDKYKRPEDPAACGPAPLSSALVPSSEESAQKARADALQAAAKLLGIK